ncbi:MAG TPA: ABC transporter permease [Nocardioides sp.]|jgi:osmoprotectant transport system permease protein|nr:ABC transporter permease [Nocardioides sp.]
MRNLRDAWDYLVTGSNWGGSGGMWHLLVQQLLLSVTALLAAMLIGLTLALWLGHLGRAGFLSVNVTNVGRAVPTFALLAILVTLDHPGTATFGPYGRAGLATLIALALFALPPIFTNAYVAVREVPAPVKESAAGMGMTGSQQFWRVELPLAMPLVVSGIRLALVQVWATATIAALVAGPGLGSLITEGFYRTDYPKGIAAAFVVAVVAFVLEVAGALVERGVDPNRKGTATRSTESGARTAEPVGT